MTKMLMITAAAGLADPCLAANRQWGILSEMRLAVRRLPLVAVFAVMAIHSYRRHQYPQLGYSMVHQAAVVVDQQGQLALPVTNLPVAPVVVAAQEVSRPSQPLAVIPARLIVVPTRSLQYPMAAVLARLASLSCQKVLPKSQVFLAPAAWALELVRCCLLAA